MSRKASLQLSVNAIVVLVLAITMLGIGISFTKGLFNDIKFDKTVDLPKPTMSSPWSIPSDQLKFATNGDTQMNVKFMNTASNEVPADVWPQVKCSGSEDDDFQTDFISTTAAAEKVPAGQSAEYVMIIDESELSIYQTGGTYSCKFVMCKDDTGPIKCESKSDTIFSSKPFIMKAQTA